MAPFWISPTAVSTAASMPFFRTHRVGAGGHVAQALAHHRPGEDRGGRGAVTGDVVGLLGDFLDELGADLLVRVLELDLLGDRDAVVRDRGGTPLLLEHDVAALRAEGDPYRVGELVHARLEGPAGVLAVGDLLRHTSIPPGAAPSQVKGASVSTQRIRVLTACWHSPRGSASRCPAIGPGPPAPDHRAPALSCGRGRAARRDRGVPRDDPRDRGGGRPAHPGPPGRAARHLGPGGVRDREPARRAGLRRAARRPQPPPHPQRAGRSPRRSCAVTAWPSGCSST